MSKILMVSFGVVVLIIIGFGLSVIALVCVVFRLRNAWQF